MQLVGSDRQNDPQDQSKSQSGSKHQTEYKDLRHRIFSRQRNFLNGWFDESPQLCWTRHRDRLICPGIRQHER